jgi:hypothetical protein
MNIKTKSKLKKIRKDIYHMADDTPNVNDISAQEESMLYNIVEHLEDTIHCGDYVNCDLCPSVTCYRKEGNINGK